MHAVLKECEETLFTRPLPPARVERLKAIKDGCDKVLVDLQSLVQGYESLGTQSKRTWDRMRWGIKDIAEIRARLTSNATLLTVFISTSQVSVETKLDKFIDEFRQGRREGSIVSLQTVDSLSTDDRAVWRTIRKELEEIGISVAAFDANRNFILDWFVHAVETGAFEEQNEHNVDEGSNFSDGQESRSNDEEGGEDTGRSIEHTDFETLERIREAETRARPLSSKPNLDAKKKVPKRGPKTLDHIVASTRTAPNSRTHLPRVAALLAGISRPRRRLLKAVDTMDVSKVLKILKDEVSFHLLDLETLDRALWSATHPSEGPVSFELVRILVENGADINHKINEATPLQQGVVSGDINFVRILVEYGAEVHFKTLYPQNAWFYSGIFAPRAILTKNIAILRLLLSAGLDVNSQYETNLRSYTGRDFGFRTVTLIQEAASLGAVPAIDALLEYGAEIDFVSPIYGTALMLALWNGQEEAAQSLLVKGADPNANVSLYDWPLRRDRFNSPMEAAIFGGKLSTIKLMLSWGVVPDYPTLEYAEKVGEYNISRGENEKREIRRLLLKAMHSNDIVKPPKPPRPSKRVPPVPSSEA